MANLLKKSRYTLLFVVSVTAKCVYLQRIILGKGILLLIVIIIKIWERHY